LLAQLKDLEILKAKFEDTDVGYEKVQIFRIASKLGEDATAGDAAFKKFVNESHQHRERVRDAAKSARVRCGTGARSAVVLCTSLVARLTVGLQQGCLSRQRGSPTE
jgi:hypothetical protein